MTNNLSSLELAVAQSDALSAVIPAQAGIHATIGNLDVDGEYVLDANSSSFLCSSQESTPLKVQNKSLVAAIAGLLEWIPVTSTGMKSNFGIEGKTQ